MSKRSHQKRKERKKKRSTSGGQRASAVQSPAAATAAPAEEHHGLDIPDEILHAPRQTSKLRFALMIGLVIFLLIIFIVPSAMLGVAGGGSGDPTYMSFAGTDNQRVEVSGVDFYDDLRAFSDAFAVDFIAAIPLGVSGQRAELDDRAMARILVLEHLAREAGVHVTRQDLGEHIQQLNQTFGRSPEVYLAQVQRYGTDRIENTLQRALTVSRYLQLIGHAGAIPDPQKIEEFWHTDHEELAFDYIQLRVEDVKELAREELPGDEELALWLDDQPEDVREDLKTPERRSGEFVFFGDLESTPGTGLLEAFPEPEPEGEAEPRTPEQLADEYYNRTYFFRFKKETPEGEEVPLGAQQFFTLEEVREQATAEAPIYFALQRWLSDLQQRQTAGEEIDLGAEAAGFGLEHVTLEESVTRDELLESEMLAGDDAKEYLVNALFQTPEGAFNYSTIVTGTRMGLSRVLSIEERTLPPFEEIKDEVAEAWVEPRATELAQEKLQAAWDTLEEFTPETDEDDPIPVGIHRRVDDERFQAIAAENGFTHGRRDYVDKGGSVSDDPDWEADPNKFIATNPEFFVLAVDEVAAPRMSRDGKACYLVRMAGKREVPVELMSPPEYDTYKTRARSFALGEVAQTLDYDTLANKYGIWLATEDAEEETGTEGDGASE